MKKLALLMLLVAFAFGGFVSAEVKEITIGGTIDLDLIWRNNFTDMDNDAKDQPAYAELEVNVPIVAKFTENVSAEIELEESTNSNGVGRNNIGFDIDEAFITCKEFLWDKLTFQLGKQPVNYSLRGANGKKSLRRNQSWLIGVDDPLGTFFRIDATDAITFDVFWFKFDERSKKGMNSRTWATNSETGNSSDQDLYGMVFTYSWNELNVLRASALYFQDHATNSSVLNNGLTQPADRELPILAVGTDLYFLDKALELYGELGYQFGENDDPAGQDIDAFGGYVGLEYTWGQNWHPYLGIDILYLEGDDDDDAQWQDFDSEYTTAFIFEGYNHINDTPYRRFETGGYWRVSAVGGLKTLPHRLKLDVAISWLQDTDDSADNAAGDNIGWEADAILGWNYTDDLKFELGFGWFFVDDDYAQNGGSRGVNGYNPTRDDDDVWQVVFNSTIKF